MIDEESGTWNEDSVRAFFRDDIAAEILCIPISRHGGVDFASWALTKSGEYSVRSAYNMARSARFLETRSKCGSGLSSNVAGEERSWKAIWSIKAPNKMKVVLWRFAHDCLPSGAQLQRRHVPDAACCCFCGRLESVEHATLFCPRAKFVWDAIKEWSGIQLRRSSFRNTKLWLF